MFSYVSLEQRVPSDHPLREVRKVTDVVLHTLSPELDALYAEAGRPSYRRCRKSFWMGARMTRPSDRDHQRWLHALAVVANGSLQECA